MASSLPSNPLTDCCTTCTTPVAVNVPGPEGPAAAPCTPCVDGLNAFATIVGGSVLVPAYGDTATIELSSPPGSLWIGQGQTLYVQSFGYFRVDAIPDPTHVTLYNWGYAGNVNGNGILTFTAGERVQPGGLAGTTGSTPAGAFLIANNLNEGVAATMRTNLGLGTIATAAAGDYFAVANNLSEGVAATKRTNLGLGSAAVKDAGIANTKLPPVDQVAGLTAGQAIFATASGVESKTASAARTALGIGGLVANYILLQNHQAGDAAAFASGGSVAVPLNTEVSDTGGLCSLNAGTFVFTLSAGTYRIRATVPAWSVGIFQALLFNVTLGSVVFYGTNGEACSSAPVSSGLSFVVGRFTVPFGGADYQLRAQCITGAGAGGFGKTTGFGNDVYASCELEQEA